MSRLEEVGREIQQKVLDGEPVSKRTEYRGTPGDEVIDCHLMQSQVGKALAVHGGTRFQDSIAKVLDELQQGEGRVFKLPQPDVQVAQALSAMLSVLPAQHFPDMPRLVRAMNLQP